MKTNLALFGLTLLGVTSALAQSYSIDWFTIDGGGGTSTGSVYSVSGTIGQPDAGKMSGGNFTIDGGSGAPSPPCKLPARRCSPSPAPRRTPWPYSGLRPRRASICR